MPKRKSNLKANLKRIEKAGESLSGVKVSNDPKRAELELRLLGVSARIKKEGLSA